MASTDVIKFGEVALYGADPTLGHVVGEITEDVMGELYETTRVTPFIEKTFDLNPGGYGDVIAWEKLNNEPSIETVTAENWDSTPSFSIKDVGKDQVVLNIMRRFGVRVPQNRSSFSKNWVKANQEFLREGREKLSISMESAVINYIRQNAGGEYTSTGDSGGDKYISMNDMIDLRAKIRGYKMKVGNFMGFFNGYDMDFMRKAIEAKVPALRETVWTTLADNTEIAYKAWGINFMEHELMPSIVDDSSGETTHHSILFDRNQVVLATKNPIPRDVDILSKSITYGAMIDEKTGLAVMTMLYIVPEPAPEYRIVTSIFCGVKLKRANGAIDIQSVQQPEA